MTSADSAEGECMKDAPAREFLRGDAGPGVESSVRSSVGPSAGPCA